jgi:SAM-dependent methyltransferase
MSDTVDLQAVAKMQQKTWSEGDFAMVAGLVMMVAEELAEALDLIPDERVLDVACGSGNGAIAAARRTWGNVVGVDFVPALLERGRERAAAERLEIEFVEGDATALPVKDAEFDAVMSTFGAMFAADQEKAAAELLRACKPGGRIGMANWVPDGGVGQMFMTIAKHAPPPPGVQSPLRWGTDCASCSATVSRSCGSSAARRGRHSARPTTSSSSSAPTSARPRSLMSGSGPRAKRR